MLQVHKCKYRPGQPNWEFWLWSVDLPQCGNLANFLPLWFHVKSNLADFRRSKTAVFNNFEGFRFWSLEKFHTWIVKSVSKFSAAQMVTMAGLGASKWSKLISRKIWVVEKSWNFHIVYSQLSCPYCVLNLKSHFQNV